MAKRRLRIFPVFCVILVLALAVWAIILVVGSLSDKPEKPANEEVVTPVDIPETNEDVPPEPEVVIPEQPEMPETPEEDKTVFVTDAPKPVYTHAELIQMYPDAVLDSSEDAGDAYVDGIIFIGDSTTHGMAFYGVLDGGKETTQVWTPKSGTLAMWNLLTEHIVYPDDDSEMLISDAISIKRPETVVLTLGVNGVSSLDEADFKKYYQGLIDAIKDASPDTKIILQSIYPVCDYYQYVNSISMEKINRANSWIVQLANDNGIYYLNTITSLVNEKGYLNDNYCNGDGIHISKEGFNVILDYIRTHAID